MTIEVRSRHPFATLRAMLADQFVDWLAREAHRRRTQQQPLVVELCSGWLDWKALRVDEFERSLCPIDCTQLKLQYDRNY